VGRAPPPGVGTHRAGAFGLQTVSTGTRDTAPALWDDDNDKDATSVEGSVDNLILRPRWCPKCDRQGKVTDRVGNTVAASGKAADNKDPLPPAGLPDPEQTPKLGERLVDASRGIPQGGVGHHQSVMSITASAPTLSGSPLGVLLGFSSFLPLILFISIPGPAVSSAATRSRILALFLFTFSSDGFRLFSCHVCVRHAGIHFHYFVSLTRSRCTSISPYQKVSSPKCIVGHAQRPVPTGLGCLATLCPLS